MVREHAVEGVAPQGSPCLRVVTRDLRGARLAQLSAAGRGPASASTERGASTSPPPFRVPAVSEGKSTLDISLQNKSPPCLTLSFTGLFTALGPISTGCSVDPVKRQHVLVV